MLQSTTCRRQSGSDCKRHRNRHPDAKKLPAELHKVEARLERAVDAIEITGFTDTLRDQMVGREPVEPVGNVLVATVATTGAGLINSSPAPINRSFMVAGACFVLSPPLPQRIRLK